MFHQNLPNLTYASWLLRCSFTKNKKKHRVIPRLWHVPYIYFHQAKCSPAKYYNFHWNWTPGCYHSKYCSSKDMFQIFLLRFGACDHVARIITWTFWTLSCNPWVIATRSHYLMAMASARSGAKGLQVGFDCHMPAWREMCRPDVKGMWLSGGRLNKKDGLTRYGNSHVKDKTS